MAPKKGKEKEALKEKKKEFVWTDEEAELLLNVAIEYKVSKAAESTDWESVKSKYEDITELFIAALPDDSDDDFPHSKDEITKQILGSKLKSIRLKFRQAVDSGRRSGHGRVVMIYYELCEKLWGGSPATEQIQGGIESSEVELNNDTGTESATGTTVTNEDPIVSENEDEDRSVSKETTKQRRSLLDDKLKNYRQEKLKRKLPLDTQLLDCAEEDVKVKKRLIDEMDKMDKKYEENMERMSRNMEKLTECIADGFGLLKQMMYQPPPTYNPYNQHPPPTYNAHFTQASPHTYNTRTPSYPSSTHSGSASSPSSPAGFDYYAEN